MREPWKQDVLEEKKQLDERISNLDAFVLTAKFDDLHESERTRLGQQSVYMKKYQNVLHERMISWRYPEKAVRQ